VLGVGSRLLPDGMRGKKRLQSLHQDPATRRLHTTTIFPYSWRSAMYSPDFFAQLRQYNPYDRFLNVFHSGQHLDTLAQMQYLDVQTYLADDILVKVDKASMFNSLETRAPLLDHCLAEYVASLPSHLRVRQGHLKYLLKQIAAEMLPPAILSRPKQGFAAPIKQWFRADLTSYARELLDSRQARQRGIFDEQFIRNLLKAHASSRLVNHSEAIWALLCLELWFQAYIDEPGQPKGLPLQLGNLNSTR